MGIVNVTPDSFSDGGLFQDAQAAIVHGLDLVGEGADILDVGGESTRPGAEPVGEAEELRRVVPVIEGLVEEGWRTGGLGDEGLVEGGDDDGPGAGAPAVQISIDTSKAAVARAALAAGATLVNDVSALRADPEMAAVVADSRADCCLMHMLGEPRTMQREPHYADVLDEVKAFLEERLRFAVDAGIAEERILLDPGIGFGKTVEHNLALLCRLDELTTLGRPLVVGTSRKSFLGRLLADARDERGPKGARGGNGPHGAQGEKGEKTAPAPKKTTPAPMAERLPGTIASSVMAYERGATVLRVHDVAPLHAALTVAAATLAQA